MPAVLRTVRPDDVPALLALEPAGAPQPAAERAELLAGLLQAAATGRDPCCLVADRGGRPAGYVLRRPGHLLGRDFVEALLVQPRHRRQGIGLALLRAAAADCAGRRVWTSTDASNLPMRAMLAGDGWVCAGRLHGFDDGDPELFFHRAGDRPGRPGVLYHLATRQDWERAVRDDAYRTSTLGASLATVGFIHTSFGHQVAGVAAALHAAERQPLVLLEIARARLVPTVRLEPSADEMFPHLYGPLDPAAVVAVHLLGRDRAGRLLLPPPVG
jgi:uncharacterized protein (DUF952 family)/ribosomal protein S18 acetylase RimI-like enzyme